MNAHRLWAVTARILRQFARDKRTIALVFVAPVAVLWLLSLVFAAKDYDPKLALVDVPAPLGQALDAEHARAHAANADVAAAELAADDVDAVVSFAGGKLSVKMEGSDPTHTKAVMMAIQRAASTLLPQQSAFQPDITFLHGKLDMAAFDNFGPVLVGFLVFFFTFIVAGMSFVRERSTGTLERMLATPLRRAEIVIGYALGFAVIVVLQSALITTVSVKLLDMMLVGSFGWLLAIVMLLALTALSLGMLLSAFARSEFQMFQFIPLVIVPQIFFSGLFPTENMSKPLQVLGAMMPLSFGAHAMREVMIRGGGFDDIKMDMAALLGFVVVFLTLNVLALRAYRRL